MEEDLRGRFGEGGPARTLSAAARRTAAAAGILLRAFAREGAGEGDRLWLLAPVDPALLDAPPGLPRPVLESGPPEALPPAERVLAWGEGPRVAALRARWGAGPAVDEKRALRAPLDEAVWHLPVPPPEVVARVAHRGSCLELARAAGLALPGARPVMDPAEIEAHLGAAGAAAGGDRWVVKAPYAAAGRERVLATGARALAEPRLRRRIEGLFERHGLLLFEPWVERTGDFGCAGLVTAGGVRLASVHRQDVDARGTFRGIALPPSPTGDPGLAPEERRALEAAFHRVGTYLRDAGYAGPFGVDAYRWRRPDGTVAFHPLGELNPRLTVGLVARALADRLDPAGRAALVGPGMGREGIAIRMLPPGGRVSP